MTKRLMQLGVLLLLTAQTACQDQSVVEDRYESIPNREWQYDFRPEVRLRVDDAEQSYKLFVNLRHAHNYRYSNLYLLLQQQEVLENGLALAEPDLITRVELRLAEPDGRWLGRQSGNLYHYREVAVDEYFFPDTGWYKISLEQNMRDDPLEGVVSAGLRIEKTNLR